MRVLVACEFSGIVRDAFIKEGHDAISVDLLPTERPGPHVQADILEFLKRMRGWTDLMLAFPPCTHLASSGAAWFREKRKEQQAAVQFVRRLWEAPIPRICLENPIGVLSTKLQKPSQIIQPWMFGHGETKATCLWLKGLPLLRPTRVVSGRKARVWREPPGPERWKNRSRTLPGIARAMARQWGLEKEDT